MTAEHTTHVLFSKQEVGVSEVSDQVLNCPLSPFQGRCALWRVSRGHQVGLNRQTVCEGTCICGRVPSGVEGEPLATAARCLISSGAVKSSVPAGRDGTYEDESQTILNRLSIGQHLFSVLCECVRGFSTCLSGQKSCRPCPASEAAHS